MSHASSKIKALEKELLHVYGQRYSNKPMSFGYSLLNQYFEVR